MRSRFGLVGLAALVAAGCGSSKHEPSAYVSASAATQGPYVSQPTKLRFSVDGDLTAEHLKWLDWGQAISVGKGVFVFRDYPSNASDAVNGSVTLSQPKACNGKLYYTAGVVNAPGGPFKPAGPATFSAGC
jgi:hypothetical protein